MKIAVAGKGGVGKTTIAGTLARLIAKDGGRVLAVDADPAMNLAYALGIPREVALKIVPISENSQLIEERTGAKPDSSGSVFSLTPKVNDIAERFGVEGPDRTMLIVMGTVKSGGAGCMCPANSLLRALLRHMLLERGDAVVLDMEAGLEHLGRGTVRGVDALIDVVEPGAQSIETARRIVRLAKDLGVKDVVAVGNKVAEDEEQFLRDGLKEIGLEPLCVIPYDKAIAEADRRRVAPVDFAPESSAVKAIRRLKDELKQRYP